MGAGLQHRNLGGTNTPSVVLSDKIPGWGCPGWTRVENLVMVWTGRVAGAVGLRPGPGRATEDTAQC